MTQPLRSSLGDFSSIVCFKAVVVGTEEALGARAALVTLKAAGRKRGHDLVASLGLTGVAPAEASQLRDALDGAIGKNGTRLCAVDKVERDGDTFRVYTSETICSAGEPQGSDRECSFTQGAIHGAVEAVYGIKLRCKQIGSVLRGQDHDTFELVPRD